MVTGNHPVVSASDSSVADSGGVGGSAGVLDAHPTVVAAALASERFDEHLVARE